MLAVNWVQGDTEPLAMTVTDRTGKALDLTGATGTLAMWQGSTVKVDDQPVTITGAAAGEWEYQWQAADVDTPGVYEARATFTRSGKDISTVRMSISIEARRG